MGGTLLALLASALALAQAITVQPLTYLQWKANVEKADSKSFCRIVGGLWIKKQCSARGESKLKCRNIKNKDSCVQAGCKHKSKKGVNKCKGKKANFSKGARRVKVGDIWTGGPIVTMEEEGETIDDGCVIVRGGMIFEVLEDGEACRTLFTTEKGWEYHDLNGRTLMPGFIEPHMHPGLAAVVLMNEILAMYPWDIPGKGLIPGAKNEEEYDFALQFKLDNFEYDGVMFKTWGYHHLWHGNMTRAKLTKMAPNFPAAVIHRSFHEIILNDQAMELLEVTEELWAGNPQANYEEGHCWEDCWITFVARGIVAAQLFSPESYAEGLSLTSQLVIKNGITTVGDTNFPSSDADGEMALLEMEITKDLPYRIYLVPSAKSMKAIVQDTDEKTLEIIKEMPAKYDNATNRVWIANNQVKIFADGAMYSQAMQMQLGYTDNHHGEWMTQLDELRAQIQVYWDAGYKINVHVNGDLGVEELLDIVEDMVARKNYDHQFTMHHMGYFTEAQADRMAKLNIEGSANPYYLWALAEKYAEHGLDEFRAHNLVALKLLTDRGIPVSLHSDFSMAPAEPLTLAWVAANRITASGKRISQDQRISVWNALRGITIDAARTLSLENEIGTIKKDKKADFVILDRNPLARDFDPEDLNKIKVDHVVFEGRELSDFTLE